MKTVAKISATQIREILSYEPKPNEVFSVTVTPLWNAEQDQPQGQQRTLFGALNAQHECILVDNFTEAQSVLTQ